MSSDRQEAPQGQGELPQRYREIVDPDLIKQFLQLQIEEISVRRQELELHRNQQENVHEVSKLSLEAQLRDRESARQHRSKELTKRYAVFIVALLTGAGFLAYTMAIGKDEIALEVVKIVGAAILGGAGGYAIGIKKKKQR